MKVLFEKEGEQVAHVKYTVLLMPTGTMQITGVGSCPLATVRSNPLQLGCVCGVTAPDSVECGVMMATGV